jgi:hypothetical protein
MAGPRVGRGCYRNGKLDSDALMTLLVHNVREPEALIEINRRTGCELPLADIPSYVASHFGNGLAIRIADRQFRGFVVIASNGVATGWRAATTSQDTPCS